MGVRKMSEMHPSVLNGKILDGYTLHVANVFPGRFVEETNFELYLKAADGAVSENPVVKGKYFSGRGKFYKPWLEIYYDNISRFESSKTVRLSENNLDEKLFKHLTSLIPSGSHIMVFYSNDKETRKGLERGVPAPATPIGYLLWKSGCTWFKDWYFAEGFLEGDVKLQGSKPVNEKYRQKNLLEISRVLDEFLKKEKSEDELFVRARRRAREIITSIKSFH